MPNGWAKHHFAELLSIAPTPELAAMARMWAGDSQNPKVRLSGLLLLPKVDHIQASHALILNAVFNEQDVDVLPTVLSMLIRPGVQEPRLTRKVVARLHDLTRHNHPVVRAGAIQKMAEWDRAHITFAADVMRLLSDAEPEVRIAAIGARSIAGMKTEPVKQRLLEMLGNSKEHPQIRAAAEMNLQDFDLDEEDYALFLKAVSAEDLSREPVLQVK